MAREFDDGDIERLKKNTSIEAVCRDRGAEGSHLQSTKTLDEVVAIGVEFGP
jgi:hypothetical protein